MEKKYNVLVDKYRPKDFSDIIGQDIIVNILKKILKTPNEYPKNFLFYGEKGIGKTSLARVFASEYKNLIGYLSSTLPPR